jgi:predicted secreted hydrolase
VWRLGGLGAAVALAAGAVIAGAALAVTAAGGPPSAASSSPGAAGGPSGAAAGPPGAAAEAWEAARAGYRWSFPRDHWAHPGYRTEWWYLTGHLDATTAPGRRFGYQLTLFRIGLLRERPALASAWAVPELIMGHAAVTDLAGGRHVFSEVLYRAVPFLGGFGQQPDPRLAWSRAPAGTDGEWSVVWNGAAFDVAAVDRVRGIAFRLATRPRKPLVFQGPDGVSRKGAGPTAASLYYSFTRLATEGTLTVDGRQWAVQGESWMDKEFGSNQLEPHQVGWDWFSLQLADGRELMLYLLRDRTGRVDFARGTVVAASGQPRYLAAEEFSVRATGRWRSPATGVEYPAGWRVEVPGEGLRVEVVPELADQENRSARVPGLHYWEGAVAVRGPAGAPSGRGYVELVGYGASARPAL